MSSGSDPHLMALLRAIRLRLAAPEAAAAGAADADAALGGGSPSTGTPGSPVRPEHPARLGLPPAPPHRSLPAGPAGAALPAGAGPGPFTASHVPAEASTSGSLPEPPVPAAQPPVLDDPGQPIPGGLEPPVLNGPKPPVPNGVRPPLPNSATRGDPAPLVPREAAPAAGHRIPPIPPARGGPIAVDPVPGLSAVGRTVPGPWPEQPNPAMLFPGPRPVGPVPGTPPVTAPGAPAPLPDGMDPADDAALREVQRLLGNSLSMAGGPDEVATRLRAALLLAHPQLVTMLPGSPLSQREQLAQALTWLVHHVDRPPALVAGCVQLGAALAECGVHPQALSLVGAALAEAMRAGMAANGWRQDFDQAWRTTWQHVHEWIGHGAAGTAYQPATWTATVVSHERRRPDLAVIRFRPFLPMPWRPGQYARIELPELPGVWRPYSLAGAPRRDDVVELHVRAKTEAGVSGALVYRTAAGDRVRFGRAEGEMGLPAQPARDLLLVAGDTGVAPLKAMLGELAATGDRRSAVLFWGVRNLDELYDIEEITAVAHACHRATVVPVVSEGEAGPYASGLVTDAIAAYGEWSGHEVYLAGPPVMLAATSAALQTLGVAADRIHHDAPEG